MQHVLWNCVTARTALGKAGRTLHYPGETINRMWIEGSQPIRVNVGKCKCIQHRSYWRDKSKGIARQTNPCFVLLESVACPVADLFISQGNLQIMLQQLKITQFTYLMPECPTCAGMFLTGTCTSMCAIFDDPGTNAFGMKYLYSTGGRLM